MVTFWNAKMKCQTDWLPIPQANFGNPHSKFGWILLLVDVFNKNISILTLNMNFLEHAEAED
jgi:hypothetical protein